MVQREQLSSRWVEPAVLGGPTVRGSRKGQAKTGEARDRWADGARAAVDAWKDPTSCVDDLPAHGSIANRNAFRRQATPPS